MTLDFIEAPSPNFDPRTSPPDILVLHYTGMKTGEEAIARLRDPEAKVSSHYVVEEDGRIFRLVPEERRAWHAGKSCWQGETDINSQSIGIEIANAGHPGGLPDFPDAQVEAVTALCRDIVSRHGISPEMVLGHSDIAPVRKVDPGEKFPWDRLASAGVGHYVEPAPIAGGRFFQRGDGGPPVEAVQAMLALYGYHVPVNGEFCDKTEGVVAAFQRHFRRERVDGVADASTIDTLHRLLKALPAG